jgi:hypothetical protein
MKFVLVNGTTPCTQSFCVMCDEPMGQAICERSGRGSTTAIMTATPIRRVRAPTLQPFSTG